MYCLRVGQIQSILNCTILIKRPSSKKACINMYTAFITAYSDVGRYNSVSVYILSIRVYYTLTISTTIEYIY
jgi:hypothetical protein